jgi:hypothetical protein
MIHDLAAVILCVAVALARVLSVPMAEGAAMKTFIIAASLAAFIGPTFAGRCLLDHEENADANKICWYQCMKGPTAVTIPATRPCPLAYDPEGRD